VSEALDHALEQIWLRIEHGIREAELELAEERDLCIRLEGEVRSIRAVLERTAPEVDPAVTSTVVRVPEPAPADVSSGVVTIPPAAPQTNTEVDAEAATAPADTDAETTPDDADGERPGYMPMLEELWEIARRDG